MGAKFKRQTPLEALCAPLAQDYCAGLALGGYSTGWRVPTIRELFGIIDRTSYGYAIDSSIFQGQHGNGFWSITPVQGMTDHFWTVLFMSGSSYHAVDYQAGQHVRCVHD